MPRHFFKRLLAAIFTASSAALASLNVTLDEVREQVESIVGYGEESTETLAPRHTF